MRISEEEKAMWLEDWRQSGKSAYVYAKENGFVPWTFSRWTKGTTGNASCFVEIAREGLLPVQTHEMVIEKGEVRIRVPLTICSVELRKIISILGGAA